MALCIRLSWWWLAKLLVRSDCLLLFSALAQSSCSTSAVLRTTLFTYNWDFSCVYRPTHSPVVVLTTIHTYAGIVQVADEVSLILLRADDAFLDSHLACTMHQLVVPGMLRGAIVETSVLILVDQARLGGGVQSSLVVALRMQEKSFKTK